MFEYKNSSGDFIVGLVKAQRDSIFTLLNVESVDFHNYSLMYVEEKIDVLIQSLKMLKKQLRAV